MSTEARTDDRRPCPRKETPSPGRKPRGSMTKQRQQHCQGHRRLPSVAPSRRLPPVGTATSSSKETAYRNAATNRQVGVCSSKSTPKRKSSSG
ncbi:hypothetical protein MTO96_040869 [Rhipicephalus appendiculatus]